jgi:hypothetical protein
MVRWQGNQSALLEQRHQPQPAATDRAADVRDVDPAAEHGLLLVIPLEPLHVDCDLRVLAGERPDSGSRDDPRAKSNHQRPSAPSCALHAPPCGVGRGKQRNRILEQLAAGVGQPDRTAIALQQARAQLLLEGLNLTAQRRLGNMKLLGGQAEMQTLGDRDEASNLSEIEVRDPAIV